MINNYNEDVSYWEKHLRILNARFEGEIDESKKSGIELIRSIARRELLKAKKKGEQS